MEQPPETGGGDQLDPLIKESEPPEPDIEFLNLFYHPPLETGYDQDERSKAAKEAQHVLTNPSRYDTIRKNLPSPSSPTTVLEELVKKEQENETESLRQEDAWAPYDEEDASEPNQWWAPTDVLESYDLVLSGLKQRAETDHHPSSYNAILHHLTDFMTTLFEHVETDQEEKQHITTIYHEGMEATDALLRLAGTNSSKRKDALRRRVSLLLTMDEELENDTYARAAVREVKNLEKEGEPAPQDYATAGDAYTHLARKERPLGTKLNRFQTGLRMFEQALTARRKGFPPAFPDYVDAVNDYLKTVGPQSEGGQQTLANARQVAEEAYRKAPSDKREKLQRITQRLGDV